LQKGYTRLAGASDKVFQLLAHGRWFSLGTPASSTTKTGRHDIAEILLKVALNTINQIKLNQITTMTLHVKYCCISIVASEDQFLCIKIDVYVFIKTQLCNIFTICPLDKSLQSHLQLL
jgi:hypothetical protein